MGKAFIINGIDASGIALKQVTPVSKMTDVTSSLIIHSGYMFLEYQPGNDNTLRTLENYVSFVLDVSSYQGKKLVMYIPSRDTTSGAYWRAFAQSFTSPITAADWSSVTSITQNAITPSSITPYIGGEHPSPATMVWKEAVVPSDANYLVVSYGADLADQVKVYVEP